ncbi:beta-galactosidase-1-like protein 3 isoform X3 [Homo sapiens]|uniref:beta-galactosidase-1-like protein 3 isoform X3 n=1 Tax=Homo sapiens TaxID=9606 RepID=UPI0005D0158C|nr:beta-galactosidase-1-like protein 3 isoform X3 [Homo sapiens]|eukprot:XP_011540870.1 beta-galactosidase-1-like protein 3 isoform X3 [Homo sapiens]
MPRCPGPGPAWKTRLCRGPPPWLWPLKRPRHSFPALAARWGRNLPLVTVVLSPFSPCLSWKRMAGIFFLPFISSGFAPRFKQEENFMLGRAHPSQPRFNWSHLTPLELKNRSVGLGTESTGRGKPHFTLEGHKFLIFGGSIHYFRVPREYWRDRLLKLKACGFNTVTTYVPWNLHEPERGKFDFSGNLDLEAFVLMAAEIGLWVILRPGRYICSEMDLGGLPSWLLQDPRLLLRTTNKSFIEAVEKYFDHLIPRVIPLQYRQAGPVIAVQVENEYGSFNKDKTYMPYLHKALLRRGIVELLLTSDVLAAINLQKLHQDTFNQLHKVQRDKPLLIMEYWVGWFDRWGDKHHVKDAKEVEHAVSEFIKYEISFNVYMFHGGTNFGFMNGATYFGKHSGIVTSYDYDAVLTEAGDYTEKYLKLQKLFQSVSATPLPRVPKLPPKAVYPPVRPSLYLPLWDALSYLNEPVRSRQPVNMENLPINNGSGQSYGLVLYEKSICSGGRLRAHAHDVAQVFLDETMIGILNENNKDLHIPELRDCRYLRILVENQGRVNFSWQIQNEQKGITGSVSINNSSLEGFTIYSLEMKMSFFERLRSATWKPVPDSHQGPAFYCGTLKAGPSPKDTFLSLLNWNYGFVFINGRNLGRYWNIGPQKTLYLPGVWLHPEDNEVILFEKMMSGSDIKSTDKPTL